MESTGEVRLKKGTRFLIHLRLKCTCVLFAISNNGRIHDTHLQYVVEDELNFVVDQLRKIRIFLVFNLHQHKGVERHICEILLPILYSPSPEDCTLSRKKEAKD